jgi:hypothetical protein
VVTLTNRSGRMLVFVLAHDHYCRASEGCRCTLPPGRKQRRLASSLTLPSDHAIADLPDAVLSVPKLAAAVAKGAVHVGQQEPAPERAEPRDPDFLPESSGTDEPSSKKRGKR